MHTACKKVLTMLFGIAIAALTAASAAAEEGYGGPKFDRLFVTPGLAYYSFPSDVPVESDDIGPAITLGYGITDRWFTEFLYSRLEPKIDLPGASGRADTDLFWLNFGFKLEPAGAWTPYLLAGGGRTMMDFNGATSDFKDTQFNAGIGVFRKLDERFSLRADVRGVHSRDEHGLEPFAFVGLTAVLGSVTPAAPLDSDGDGVPDIRDRCPGTPAGVSVDEHGCPVDSDGDGVPDHRDRCPDTPRGVTVDEHGCPLDSDGDGVPDYRDDCPDTTAGARVDDRGCYLELTETVTIDLLLEFDLDSSDLRPEHRADIQRVVQFLREYPRANAVLEGHTDSTGAEDYNQRLSERRAKSVHDYLVQEGGISASRLRHVGHGENRPVASNDTAEGRQANRRVAAVISAEQTVRQ